jgi:sigma-54 dependent transcriptional regulator, acetoin dehydrogenase operon transcriptional activator AcoR
MNHLPTNGTLQPRAARVELARQRFFEEGQAPTGAVDHAVFESWSRCLRLHRSPNERAAFEPVTQSRTQLTLLKNRQLVQAWTDELPRLESMLSSTSCAAMLTDATGVLIGSSCVGRSHEEIMPVATRLGVNLSEDAVGTTAPGVAARTGKAVSVQGGEHFFECVKTMHCAAAPIRDIRGQLAGVLDLSSEFIPFGFDAAAVVGLYAGAIEGRLLVAQSTDHLVVRFQVAPELLDSAMVAMVGIDVAGNMAWENGVARSLLGLPVAPGGVVSRETEQVLGQSWPQLAALPKSGAAPLTLPNGLTVWARSELRARDGLRGLVIATNAKTTTAQQPTSPGELINIAAPSVLSKSAEDEVTAATPPHAVTEARQQPTPRLRDSDLDLIRKTLQACGGNVSEAAQRLGVSRGLIYRRIRSAEPDPRNSTD